jgi:hypothetical protein
VHGSALQRAMGPPIQQHATKQRRHRYRAPDLHLLPATVRAKVETLELMLGCYELDSLCLPPIFRIEMEGLLDGFAGPP